MKFYSFLTKQNTIVSAAAFIFGILCGVTGVFFMIPDASRFIVLYDDQKKLVSELRTGKNADTSAIWLENAKSMRAKSKDEYISDMININNTVVLMNNRLQLGMYPSTKELRYFGDQAAEERKNEVEILRKIEAAMK